MKLVWCEVWEGGRCWLLLRLLQWLKMIYSAIYALNNSETLVHFHTLLDAALLAALLQLSQQLLWRSCFFSLP